MKENKYFNTKDVTVYLAGAGCGKTTALMGELKAALEIYRTDEIAFVSFSRKASSETRNRAEQMGLEYDPESFPYFKTIHSLCYMLNDYSKIGKKIIDAGDTALFAKATNMRFNIHDVAEGMRNQGEGGQLYFDLYALERATGKPMQAGDRYETFKELYEMFKEEAKLVDYHDCLTDYLKDGEPVKKIKFAIIDEAQDLTMQQWAVCFKAFKHAKSVRIAGDDWQSIFAFQGASPQVLIDMANTYNLVRLEQSYRLPMVVAKLAEVIVSYIGNKVEKRCLPVNDRKGEIQSVIDLRYLFYTLEHSGEDTWYLLCRVNFQIRQVADMLRDQLILFHYSDSFCIPESYLQKLRSFYKWASELEAPDDSISFCKKNWIQATEDGKWPPWWHTNLIDNPKMRALLYNYEQKYGFDVLWKACTSAPRILVTTTFKVKGGEADRVVVFTASTKKVEAGKFDDFDNELRVLYTAVTRAKKAVYFSGLKGNVDSSAFINSILNKVQR